jgi:hypothetical protein
MREWHALDRGRRRKGEGSEGGRKGWGVSSVTMSVVSDELATSTLQDNIQLLSY